jgi:peptidoglycan hydrolase-like protein with peptidoglycan-binding domain
LNKGYDPKGIDGIWGKNTEAAVKKFQRENTDTDGKKLVVDGYVGPKTWGALYK